ncbi:hypothetical protein J2804_003091 [Paraburkholderia terricola]|uniref:Transposase n=1 Tax=Paraburkholderia terricola TaxID=169427 RepID=A0ABU1LSH1_9BURK|nr:hypothetical protein [Paraburkholderia terricola]
MDVKKFHPHMQGAVGDGQNAGRRGMVLRQNPNKLMIWLENPC